MTLEGQLLRALWAARPGRRRRELQERLDQLSTDLLKLKLDVRELDHEVLVAELNELRSHSRHGFARPPDSPGEQHEMDVSNH